MPFKRLIFPITLALGLAASGALADETLNLYAAGSLKAALSDIAQA